jgi:hypothetical protein
VGQAASAQPLLQSPKLLHFSFSSFFPPQKIVDILRRTLSDSGLRLRQDECAPSLTEIGNGLMKSDFSYPAPFLSFAPRQRRLSLYALQPDSQGKNAQNSKAESSLFRNYPKTVTLTLSEP